MAFTLLPMSSTTSCASVSLPVVVVLDVLIVTSLTVQYVVAAIERFRVASVLETILATGSEEAEALCATATNE